MAKLWRVARYAYRDMVRRRSFLIGTLGIPLLMVVVLVISIATSINSLEGLPLGYVDQAGVLDPGVPLPPNDGGPEIELRAFADEQAARAALEAGQIQAFVVLPADYVSSGRSIVYHTGEAPDELAWSRLADLVRANLVSGAAPQVQERLVEGFSSVTRSADGRREIGSNNWLNFVLPMALGVFFTIAILSSSGYLLRAVTTEKENRTMEIMVTSLSPEQLMVGKALGLIGVSLTQLGIWALTVVIGLIIGAQFVDVLQTARVPWAALGVAVLYFVPSFALVAGMMISIGSMVTDTQQGQQISGVLSLFFSLPFFFIALIMANPNNPVVVILSLLPPTAFLTILLRWGMVVIPLWQMALSWVLLMLSAGFSLWAAARIMRVGMLQYGQRLDLRAALRALRARRGA